MKRILYLFIFLLFISSVNAQQIKRIGLRTGFNLSNYYGADISTMLFDGIRYENEYGHLPGLNGNIFIEIEITDAISFQPEFAYMFNQFTLLNYLPTFTISTPEITVTEYGEMEWSFIEHFISIPLMLKIDMYNSNWYSFNIQNGLSIGRLESRMVTVNVDEPDNYVKKGHTTELLAIFGIENIFHSHFGDLIVNLRYQHKLFNNYKAINGDILDIRYDTYNFSIGYAYNLRQFFD